MFQLKCKILTVSVIVEEDGYVPLLTVRSFPVLFFSLKRLFSVIHCVKSLELNKSYIESKVNPILLFRVSVEMLSNVK